MVAYALKVADELEQLCGFVTRPFTDGVAAELYKIRSDNVLVVVGFVLDFSYRLGSLP